MIKMLQKKTFIEIGIIRILVVVLQLLFLKLYTNNTTLYEIGIYLLLITLSYSLNAFLLVPLDYFQQSKLYELKDEKKSIKSFNHINKTILKISIIILIIAEIVNLIIDLVAENKININNCITIFTIITLSLSTYFVVLLRGFINNLEKRRIAVYTMLFEGVLKIILFLILNHYFNSNSFIILLSLLISSIITLLLLYSILKKMDEYKCQDLKKIEYKNIIKFSYPLSIGAVINWIQIQGYRMILVPLGLVETVATFGTISNIGSSGMNAFSMIFAQLFIPNIYKTNGEYLKTYLKNALILILFILIVSFTFSDLIINLLTSESFNKYSSIIIVGVISEGGNFIIGAITVYLTLHNLNKYTIKVNLIGLTTFVLSFTGLIIADIINVYTVGIPIITSQILIVIYLLAVIKKNRV